MNNKFFVSVIIPVFNTEKYIDKCLDSLERQSTRINKEYIFINDGSTDSSLDILNSRIERSSILKSCSRVINNQSNRGITYTRQLGIKEAKGEYIAWVDSDDWVEAQWLEALYSATKNGTFDIVVQNITRNIFYEDSVTEKEQYLESAKSPQNALENLWTEKYMPRGLPYQMSRKSLIERAMAMVSSVNYAEDTFALIHLFYSASTACWTEKSYYHYRKMEDGTSLTSKRFQTKEEWEKQKKNISVISNMLLAPGNNHQYDVTVNYIKWSWKREFKIIFKSNYEYWHEYNECYNDICIMYGIKGFLSKAITYICSNNYYLYLLRLNIKRGKEFYLSI